MFLFKLLTPEFWVFEMKSTTSDWLWYWLYKTTEQLAFHRILCFTLFVLSEPVLNDVSTWQW